MPKPHRRSKSRRQAVNRKRKAKRQALSQPFSQPFPEPLSADEMQSVAATLPPQVIRRAPINPDSHAPAPRGVYLEGNSLTPEQEARARELGYRPDGHGRWYRSAGD